MIELFEPPDEATAEDLFYLEADGKTLGTLDFLGSRGWRVRILDEDGDLVHTFFKPYPAGYPALVRRVAGEMPDEDMPPGRLQLYHAVADELMALLDDPRHFCGGSEDPDENE